MCISVLSTAHPHYPFILVSNRDEHLARPTAVAHWWDAPDAQVLGGRDLQRKERGTWLGITRQGRIAILTNFREVGDFDIDNSKSRGVIPNTYLCGRSDERDEDFVRRLMDEVGIHNVGGFTMLFGALRAPSGSGNPDGAAPSNGTPKASMPGLAIVSNRTHNPSSLERIATTQRETLGISNSHFGDTTWPKVVQGEALLAQLVQDSVASSMSQSELIERLFSILCVDSLPKRKRGESWDAFVAHMRNSIFIPPAKGRPVEEHDSDELRRGVEGRAKIEPGKSAYGTGMQTVILVDRRGKVTFVERTLFDAEGMPLPERDREVRFQFDIEGWHDVR